MGLYDNNNDYSGNTGDVFNMEPRLNPGSGQTFDVNAHADETIGKVNAQQVMDSIQTSQNGVGTSSIKAPIDNTIKESINPYRIQSDTPYKILGVTETKDGVIVHVNEYSTQKISPKEKRAKEFG